MMGITISDGFNFALGAGIAVLFVILVLLILSWIILSLK